MTIKQPQRGDTIIEVLMACAIVGMILVSAFIVINKTLNNSRQSQEHGEALKLAETQVERLTGLRANTSIYGGNQFCIDAANTYTPFGNSAYNTGQIDTGYYPGACQVNSLGNYKYNVSIHKTGADANRFYINVDWYGPTGTKNNVGLIYELYQ